MLLEQVLVRLLELETRERVAALFEPGDDLSDKAVAAAAKKGQHTKGRIMFVGGRLVFSRQRTSAPRDLCGTRTKF